MHTKSLSQSIDSVISKYDLLCHPFYQAWSQGLLSREEISDYACQYYQHVAAFPDYLETLQNRLPLGELRQLVTENKLDEEGSKSSDQRSHADLWSDFATGMGATSKQLADCRGTSEMQSLVDLFSATMQNASACEAVAMLYAYESQVPRVAAEKERGLKEFYGADDRSSYYFFLHKSFDVLHAKSWMEQLQIMVGDDSVKVESVLSAAEKAARALWNALDGVERERLLKHAS